MNYKWVVHKTPNVITIDMSGMIWHLLPFYLLTIGALFLFVLKLKKPYKLVRWIYAVYFVGIVGGGWIAWQFRELEKTQLPTVDAALHGEQLEKAIELAEMELDAYQKGILESRKRDATARPFGNFWIVAVPNIFFLFFTLYLDIKYAGRKKVFLKRSRYD